MNALSFSLIGSLVSCHLIGSRTRAPPRCHQFDILLEIGWRICQMDVSQIGSSLVMMKNESCPGNVSYFLIALHHLRFHNNFRVSGPIFRAICPGKPKIFQKLEFLEKN